MESKANDIPLAVELLILASKRMNKPLIVVMHKQGIYPNLEPGRMMESVTTELRPDCDGIAIAVSADAQQAQELLDLIVNWTRNKQDEISE